MQPLCWGHLRAGWADRMLETDIVRLDAMPIRLEQTLFLLMSIAMQTLRKLYHAIPLDRRNPTHPVPLLSDHWLKGDPYLSNCVPRARTFQLLATECYRHAGSSRPILFDSPHRAESIAPCPDAVQPLAEWGSIPLYLSSLGKYL